MTRSVILVSNGPGELQTWVRPVLDELRARDPELTTVVSLIPCQFASGSETRIAATFGADFVTAPAEAVRFLAGAGRPEAFRGDTGAVVSLGGNTRMAIGIGRRLGFATYRYSFIPFWHPGLRKLFVHDEKALLKARLLGAPGPRLGNIGNLVADAMAAAVPLPRRGDPDILIVPGSRDRYVRAVLPLMIEVVERLARVHPGAGFGWPVSRLLSEAAIDDAIAGTGTETIGGYGGRREGDAVITPAGVRIAMIPEQERYRAMKAADYAITIPGTNTLELGIARVPALVVLPLNKPEIIPLEGPGHWLSLLPFVGTPLKRQAVRLFTQRLRYPVSLPNQLAGEELMSEVKGIVTPEQVAGLALADLADPERLGHRRERMAATMPAPGAAARLVDEVLAGLAAGGQARP